MTLDNRNRLLPICLLLAVLTVAVYWPVYQNQFIAYDDQLYVTENPNVNSGLTWSNVQWAFTTFAVANWHPATWLSHQLDVTLFGLKPGAHHLSSLLLHTANTLLLLPLLFRLTGAVWRSAAVAAIFALHPLHVESVAWLAERKDLLCAFFFLLTLHAYARYTKRETGWSGLLPVAVLFSISLMAKPMSVTLPFVLMLMDWWPLQRFRTVPLRSIFLEKTPLLLLSAISCVVTIFAQQAGGAVIAVEKFSILERVANALASYLLYLWKMVWPHNMALLYPLPSAPQFATAVPAAVVIVLITAICFRLREKSPYLMVGWFWFLGMLVPVIGLVQVGVQSHADRYTYLPMVGCSIAAVWGLGDSAAIRRSFSVALMVFAVCLLLIYASLTRQQISTWRDSETLFRHALAVTSGNYVIHVNLATALWKRDQRDEAVSEYRKAIAICPEYPDLHFLLGNALLVQGNAMEAAAEYRKTLTLRPEFRYANTNLGVALQRIGLIEEAITQYREGLRLVPEDYKARDNLEMLLKNQKQER